MAPALAQLGIHLRPLVTRAQVHIQQYQLRRLPWASLLQCLWRATCQRYVATPALQQGPRGGAGGLRLCDGRFFPRVTFLHDLAIFCNSHLLICWSQWRSGGAVRDQLPAGMGAALKAETELNDSGQRKRGCERGGRSVEADEALAVYSVVSEFRVTKVQRRSAVPRCRASRPSLRNAGR